MVETTEGNRIRPSQSTTKSFRSGASEPDWRGSDETAVGTVKRFDSELGAKGALEDVTVACRAEVEAFIEDMDFVDSLLLYFASVGPNACYDMIDVLGLAVDASTLLGEISAINTSEDKELCAQVITFQSALVRATFDDVKPNTIVLTIIDGWKTRRKLRRRQRKLLSSKS